MTQLTLTAQPDARASQSEKILAWLRSGNTLTPLEALDRFQTLRLGGRIYDLKKAGHDIKKRMVETRSGKHVAEYFMEAKIAA